MYSNGLNGSFSEVILSIKYSCDEERNTLYKSTGGAFVEEYIGDVLWNLIGVGEMKNALLISDEDADDIIKELESDEYDLVDGYFFVVLVGRYKSGRGY